MASMQSVWRVAALWLGIGAWLIPFFWSGWTGRQPRLPSRLAFQYNAAKLFSGRPSSWTQMLIQVQVAGSTDWVTINTEELSPMGAFGFRQRLDRMLQETQGRPAGDLVRQRMALWIALQMERLTSESARVVGVRFAQLRWAVNVPEMTNPSGAWVPNPGTTVGGPPLMVTSTFRITDAAPRTAERVDERPPPPLAQPQVFRRSSPTTSAPRSSTTTRPPPSSPRTP